MITNQEIFDKVATHLLTQNARSIATRVTRDGEALNGCSYRGEGGMRCAVGCLISDEAYKPEIEGASASNPRVLRAVFGDDAPASRTMDLLVQLQQIHDSYEIKEWPRLLAATATCSGLNVPAVVSERLAAGSAQ